MQKIRLQKNRLLTVSLAFWVAFGALAQTETRKPKETVKTELEVMSDGIAHLKYNIKWSRQCE